MSKIKYCGACRNGHVLTDSGWIRCSCVLAHENRERLFASGVPKESLFFDLQNIPGTIPELAEFKKTILSKVDPPKLKGQILLLYDENRDVVAYSILSWFSQFGHLVKSAQLEEIGDYFVGKQRDAYKVLRESPVLALFFGREMTSSVHCKLLYHLFEFRGHQGFFTVAVCDLAFNDFGRTYGKELYSFITDPKRVSVIPCRNVTKYVEKLRKGESNVR